MPLGSENQMWYALQVRTRWENSTALLLSGKGYETFLPTFKTTKKASGSTRGVASPLFPGYVFCQFDAYKRLPILVTPGVLSVVGRGRVPLPVDDHEMAAIRNIVSSGLRAEPWPYLEVGQKVRIESDALQGLEGILVQLKGNQRVVVSVSLLRRSVALEIDSCSVRPVRTVQANELKMHTAHARLQGVVA
jgi:transcription antitermination factor NusG